MVKEELDSIESPVPVNLYVIYDCVADRCSAPFAAENHELAKRQFRLAMKQTDESYRVDYYLTCVGEFDPQFGHIQPKPHLRWSYEQVKVVERNENK